MKYLLLALLLLSFNTYALDVKPWETPVKTISCTSPTEYISGDPIDSDDSLIIRLFVDGMNTGVESATCQFAVDVTVLPVAVYLYSVRAYSTKYNTESVLAAPPVEYNILAQQSPNAPTELTSD